jgi:transketolase
MPATAVSQRVRSLKEKARNIRRHIITMARGRGEGYAGQGLDAADIFSVVYFDQLESEKDGLQGPARNRFVLSTGHYSIVLFAALAEAGVFSPSELLTYGANESRLEMSASETTPGVEMTGGALGHGLSQAVGMALASRLSGRNFRVYNFLSDGELQEGSTWEAAMSAAHFKLDQLFAIVDMNNMQADGKVSNVMTVEPVERKWEAFGWHAQRINGNSIEELVAAFDSARKIEGKPKVLVCDTQLGYGVPMVANRANAHFVRVDAAEWDKALVELEAAGV